MLKNCVAWLCALVVLFVLPSCKSSGMDQPIQSAAKPSSEPLALANGAPDPLHPASSRPHSSGAFELLTNPGELPYLELARSEGAANRLPLKHTHVSATLNGMVAEVEVRQTYENPATHPIEAIYTFPLPENSAVNFMQMVIGKRTVTAEIEERVRARRRYEAAKREGFTAALMEQERPNIFTQSVANIAPGETIDVVVRYVQDLSYDRGEYEFVFPMVVGPRFMPGAPVGASGTGTAPDTTKVPDASRISPPYVGKGQRSGHDISVEVQANAGHPIASFRAVTHQVSSRKTADGTLHVALTEAASIPNRDFVLRYRAVGRKPLASLYTSGESGPGFFSLVVEPPTLDVETLVGRREVIFVVDVSGSMAGTPLSLCRRAMRTALLGLRPQDTFNIITFAGHTTQAFPQPRPADRTNLDRAFAIVNEMRAGGGTYMANAIDAALAPEVESERHRYVFFMTDGYVGNEDEILAKSAAFVQRHKAQGKRAKVFGFGVGSSPNRYLLGGLSKVGEGVSVYATNREDPNRAVNQFYHYIDSAVLSDVRIDWGGLVARQVYPNEIPDLFASHPLVLHGQYTGKAARAPRLLAKAGDQEIEIPISVEPVETRGDPSRALGSLWARAQIVELEETLLDGSVPDAQARITRLGLTHRLVTRFTSFVAVDTARRVGTGTPEQVLQPVERPEGVDVEAAGGQVNISEQKTVTLDEKRDGRARRTPGYAHRATRGPGVEPSPAPPPPASSSPAPADKVAEDAVSGAEEESESYDYDADDGELERPGTVEDGAGRSELDESADYEEAPATAAPVEQFESSAEVESKRGCGCRMAGDSRPGGPLLLLLAGLVGVCLLRRRPARR